MTSKSLALLAAIVFSSASHANDTLRTNDAWMVGFWHMTADEDGTPADVMEFRADGTHIFYGTACQPFPTTYHLHGGDLYVTIGVPNKGPIVAVFRPTNDRTKLVFTSPRTRNNATYERLSASTCKP